MRGPNFADRRIKGDGFRVGDVVANLREFTAMDHSRRNVQRANGEIGTAELFDDGAIFFTALLRGLLGFAAFVGAI